MPAEPQTRQEAVAAPDRAQPLVLAQPGSAAPAMKLPLTLAAAVRGKWTPADLRAGLSGLEVPVEYALSGIYRPRPDVNEGRYFRKSMPFEAALDRILHNDHYGVVHYVSTISVDDLPGALCAGLPDLRDVAGRPAGHRFLFIGNSRSGTHAHYDLPDTVLTVLAGQKRLQIFPPSQLRALKPWPSPARCCNFSSHGDDTLREALERIGTAGLSVTLDAGEMVYIPSCWWHRVTNHGFTVALTSAWTPPPARRRTWPYRRLKAALAGG
jgi:hypothetical protein